MSLHITQKLQSLLKVNVQSIKVELPLVEVEATGKDLGYDDDQTYLITWDFSDFKVVSETFGRDKKLVASQMWNEDISSLEELARVINCDPNLQGDWE